MVFRPSHLVTLTKALFTLEKPWRLGTPLLPSMLTITLSRFQTSTVFVLNHSHLIYTFILSYCFYPAFFVYILAIYIPFLSVEGYRLIAESLCYFLKLFSQRKESFYLFIILSIITYWSTNISQRLQRLLNQS